MKFRVTYTVDVDTAAWAEEYDIAPDKLAEHIGDDLAEWCDDMFTQPKWDGLATGPGVDNVEVVAL